MAEARVPAAQAYFTTSYSFNNSTTSTAALMVWRALSHHLETQLLPMTGAELSAASGMSLEQLENVFGQSYYQRFYGFRRFDTLEEWRAWAEETGVVYVPSKHDPKPEVVASDATDEDDLAEDEDEAE
ncbi:MAG TPA: hypothetical protein VK464_06205 [Symbiobacteriaceae bacterium]|jgi:hypothetical protein|nr:hypothetical protein [Symbiobacteriaceae bacterium]